MYNIWSHKSERLQYINEKICLDCRKYTKYRVKGQAFVKVPKINKNNNREVVMSIVDIFGIELDRVKRMNDGVLLTNTDDI